MNVDGEVFRCEVGDGPPDPCPLRVRVNRKQASLYVECVEHGLIEKQILPYGSEPSDEVVIRP